jgi:hypothetical protein
MKASEPLSRRCCGRDYMPVAERCEKSWAGERCALTARLVGQAQAKKAAAQRGTSLNSDYRASTLVLLESRREA